MPYNTGADYYYYVSADKIFTLNFYLTGPFACNLGGWFFLFNSAAFLFSCN